MILFPGDSHVLHKLPGKLQRDSGDSGRFKRRFKTFLGCSAGLLKGFKTFHGVP